MATFKTRILNKIDTYKNWTDANPTPLNGEICIVSVPADTGVAQQEPVILIKVGDGKTPFNTLPFIGAKSMDIYEWARAADKPAYEAKEITGIDAYIADYVNEQMGISVDTDTQYQIVKVDDYNYKLQSKGKTDSAWADVAEGGIVIPKYDDTALVGRVAAVEGAVETLNGDASTDGSVAKAIADLKLAETYEPIGKGAEEAGKVQGETTSTVKDVEDALSTYKTTNDEAVANAKKAGDDAMAEAEKKVASVTAGDASVTVAGTATAPTVAAKLSQDADNALELVEDGLKVVIPAAAEYTIEKAAESGDYAAVYALKKDGVQVGASINIPKDMVVESGSVVENPEGQAEGTYIELVLQNVEEPLYINVGSLIEYVTSGSATGDMVVIAVSDDHKVTATITDGSITLAKLATDIQTAIGKAHNHENATVLDGITEQKVSDWDDAVAKEHEHANKAELDKVAEGDVAKWNAAEQNAKDYADGLNGEMDTRVKALEDIDHDAYIAADAEVLKGAKEYADGLNTAMNTRMEAAEGKLDVLNGDAETAGSVAKALADAKAYTDELEGELHAVAKSGLISDLDQTADTYITFDCGTATTVM